MWTKGAQRLRKPLSQSVSRPPFLLSALLWPAQFTPMGPGLPAHAQMLPKDTMLVTALGFCDIKLNSALHLLLFGW